MSNDPIRARNWQILAGDPRWQTVQRQVQSGQISTGQAEQIAKQIVQAGGSQWADNTRIESNGTIGTDSFADRHKLALTLGGIAGAVAPFALPAIFGAGGAGAASAGAAGAGGGTAAGVGAGTAAGLGSAGMGTLGSYLWPGIIGAGTQLAGTVMATRGANHAADLQASAADRAAALEADTAKNQLDYLKDQDAQRTARLAPYRQFSLGALMQLGQPIGAR